MVYFEPLFFLISYSFFSVILTLLILVVIYLLNTPQPNSEKNIAYECGFKPFDFTYHAFDIQFYRIGILFLLFDVEIIFFFPWVLNFYAITLIGHLIVFIFIGVLLFGLVYEIKTKTLIWYPTPWNDLK